MKKIIKVMTTVTLVSILAGALGGCLVESRPRYRYARPYYRPVVVVPIR